MRLEVGYHLGGEVANAVEVVHIIPKRVIAIKQQFALHKSHHIKSVILGVSIILPP
jgi:hypothetical protein